MTYSKLNENRKLLIIGFIVLIIISILITIISIINIEETKPTMNYQTGDHFIKNSGINTSDCSGGTTDSSAWQTPGQIKNCISETSTNIFFKCNNHWPMTEFSISHSGTKRSNIDGEKEVLISHYYLKDNQIITGEGCPMGESFPIISGDFITNDNEGNVPSESYNGLIRIRGSYVTVRGLNIINSSAIGIAVAQDRHHTIIENNIFNKISRGSVYLDQNTHSNIIRNNQMIESTLSRVLGFSSNYSGCISINNSDNNLIENNLIEESECDGINPYDKSDYNIIKGNEIYGVAKSGIYIDGSSNTIVESNLIAGGVSGEYSYSRSNAGISINSEDVYAQSNNANGNIIRNNLITNVRDCFALGIYESVANEGKIIGAKFIGNTCVAYEKTINQTKFTNAVSIESQTTNNLFNQSILKETGCDVPGNTTNNIFSYNLFDIAFDNNNCNSENDVIGIPPLNRTDTFFEFGVLKKPAINDFALDTTDANIAQNTGTNLTTIAFDPENYPIRHAIQGYWDDNNSSKLLYYDFLGNKRDGITDIGALEEANDNPPTLPPSKLINITILVNGESFSGLVKKDN